MAWGFLGDFPIIPNQMFSWLRDSRKGPCARMGPQEARRSTGGFSAVNQQHISFYRIANMLFLIRALIIALLAEGK